MNAKYFLNDLELAESMMPRDVRLTTRWNSTFDMLDFAVEHITGQPLMPSPAIRFQSQLLW
jgi:hypothetical protein